MNNTRLKNIIDNLNIKGKMRYIEGVTPKQVIDFEKTNGVKLPQQYKDWLEYSDEQQNACCDWMEHSDGRQNVCSDWDRNLCRTTECFLKLEIAL